jgi:hypothetical protein
MTLAGGQQFGPSDVDGSRDHPRFQALIEKYEKKHGT